jgi:hypothetical protein
VAVATQQFVARQMAAAQVTVDASIRSTLPTSHANPAHVFDCSQQPSVATHGCAAQNIVLAAGVST